jgi:hypothetical protein
MTLDNNKHCTEGDDFEPHRKQPRHWGHINVIPDVPPPLNFHPRFRQREADPRALSAALFEIHDQRMSEMMEDEGDTNEVSTQGSES